MNRYVYLSLNTYGSYVNQCNFILFIYERNVEKADYLFSIAGIVKRKWQNIGAEAKVIHLCVNRRCNVVEETTAASGRNSADILMDFYIRVNPLSCSRTE